MTRTPKTFFTTALLACACCIAFAAQAQDAACRLTQTIVVAGQKIETDQCLQNRSMDDTQFKALCNNGSEGVPSMGIPPMKVVALAACPTQAVNTCDGFGQGKLTAYYYKKEDGPQRKQGCEATGGKFK